MFIPYGTVMAFSGSIDVNDMCGELNFSHGAGNNTGWQVCDGASLFQSMFPGLEVVIGNLYGGSNGRFNLPNYMGYFLRGLATDSTEDPGISYREPATNGTQAGVGSTQGWMVQGHEHEYNNFPGAATVVDEGTLVAVTSQEAYTTGLYTDDTGTTSLTGEETRPKNVYVYYIIYTGLPGSGVAF